MQITTSLSADDLKAIATRVSDTHYDGNLTVEVENTRGRTKRFKLGTRDSRGSGSRRSWSGRHGRYACWHAFRDVLAATFAEDTEAVVRTSMATYRGARGFLDAFPGTADQNVGSIMQPAYMDALCVEPHTDAYSDGEQVENLCRVLRREQVDA